MNSLKNPNDYSVERTATKSLWVTPELIRLPISHTAGGIERGNDGNVKKNGNAGFVS